jgi:hypothetical protein
MNKARFHSKNEALFACLRQSSTKRLNKLIVYDRISICWMMRCSDEVKNRKNFWSRDSASSDFHMYETTWFSAFVTIRLWSIALRSIRIVNLLISKWSRFAAQWRADLLILRRWSRNQASQARSYEDNRWVKYSRHDRVEDDRARRALNETVKSPRDGDIDPRMTR